MKDLVKTYPLVFRRRLLVRKFKSNNNWTILDVMVVSHLLNGALQASLSVGHIVASAELVEYTTSYASEIARVEVEKTNTTSANDDNPKDGVAQDPSLAIRPLLACIAALMNRPASQSHGPTSIISSMLSPDGHPFRFSEINLLLRQKLPRLTLRLGMTCMIQAGRRDRAD
ncbi:uncharacterized protein MELLADRAFT_114194 [Melampsora larici-populina 98AG31]|uniref:Uncharacterized protein n=1 Tax=Melampsora larici-populina (strain 98AG31 / pathotype 3-4-7) TaxID=747676 RepID=F4SCK0_MELLP|nr:uncharacterized protein MELLADRAFT_114194 [Melampsora larici-populina 98AG31]EGF97619.1 hypothetical protein MELLADRAFT_114194 [Melampsora larici-populina 98AG31]